MSRIYAIEVEDNHLKGNKSDFDDGFDEVSSILEIEQERIKQVQLFDQRMESFKDIVMNNSRTAVSFKSILYGLGSVVLPLIFVCFLTLIPVHNAILYPQYWYEGVLAGPIINTLLIPAYIVFNCSFWMNNAQIRKIKVYLMLCSVGLLALTITIVGVHSLWFYFGYQPPVAYGGLISGYSIIIVLYICLWFYFPQKWRSDVAFRRRLIYFFISIFFSQLVVIQFNMITKGLLMIDRKYQWIIALTLPLFRELNNWAMVRLASKASNGDLQSIELTCTHIMGTRYSLFLTIALGSIATLESGLVIFISDFVFNSYVCLKIVRGKRKNTLSIDKQIKLLQELTINETVEIVTPLLYFLSFCTAYFGPNVEIIGNIGSSKWQYIAIDNVESTMLAIFLFFTVDLLSAIVSAFVLWKFASINLYRAFSRIQEEFGFCFIINNSCLFFIVSNIYFLILEGYLD